MAGCVDEAHGLVRKGLLTDEDFRDFTFANPARLLAGSDPDFFAGTSIESAVREVTSAPASTGPVTAGG